ncbi:hypothetical protein PInf_005923 [Phytophthora infestans]|nr:hypothetical protein PInf_005923 [Phytophthora infestans]
MEFGYSKFPALTPRISELYGAGRSAYRVGEADAYAQDLDELEREERALENMQVATGVESIRDGEVPLDPDTQFARSSSSEEDLEEDMDEDEMMDEDSEEETTGRATIVRGEGQQRDDDSFARDVESGDDSMEMEEELPPPSDWH